MNTMLFLLLLISFFTLTFGSPAMHARQTFAPLPEVTLTACPATDPVTATWIPAATNVATIPKGLITDCQLGCLANSLGSDSNCDDAAEYWTYCFLQPSALKIGQCLCNAPTYYQVMVEDCAGCLATAQYLANLASPPSRPVPDFFNDTTGLVAQVTDVYLSFCSSTRDEAELEHLLCQSRDITAEFGSPIAMFNFTLLTAPSLAWNGAGFNLSDAFFPFSPFPSPAPTAR